MVQLYIDAFEEAFPRLFYYLLLITTREARHVHASSKFSGVPAAVKDLMLNHLKPFGSNGDAAATHFINASHGLIQDMLLLDYVQALVKIFNTCGFSSAYGGKKWGVVAECLYRLVTGESTPEVLMDTAWTLAHNNGPIFNKGMYYHTQDSQRLGIILDVQRAGQIPRLFMSEPHLLGDLGLWALKFTESPRKIIGRLLGTHPNLVTGDVIRHHGIQLGLTDKGFAFTGKLHVKGMQAPAPVSLLIESPGVARLSRLSPKNGEDFNALLQHTVKALEDSGIKKVKVVASSMAWVKYGWVPEGAEWKRVRRIISRRFVGIRKQLPKSTVNTIEKLFKQDDPRALMLLLEMKRKIDGVPLGRMSTARLLLTLGS